MKFIKNFSFELQRFKDLDFGLVTVSGFDSNVSPDDCTDVDLTEMAISLYAEAFKDSEGLTVTANPYEFDFVLANNTKDAKFYGSDSSEKITNVDGTNIYISGGAGDDIIIDGASASGSTIDGGDGDDKIFVKGNNASINVVLGDDKIYLDSNVNNVTVKGFGVGDIISFQDFVSDIGSIDGGITVNVAGEAVSIHGVSTVYLDNNSHSLNYPDNIFTWEHTGTHQASLVERDSAEGAFIFNNVIEYKKGTGQILNVPLILEGVTDVDPILDMNSNTIILTSPNFYDNSISVLQNGNAFTFNFNVDAYGKEFLGYDGDVTDHIEVIGNDNTIKGLGGDDVIHSKGSGVLLDGGAGDDFYFVSEDKNSVNVSNGNDMIMLEEGVTKISVSGFWTGDIISSATPVKSLKNITGGNGIIINGVTTVDGVGGIAGEEKKWKEYYGGLSYVLCESSGMTTSGSYQVVYKEDENEKMNLVKLAGVQGNPNVNEERKIITIENENIIRYGATVESNSGGYELNVKAKDVNIDGSKGKDSIANRGSGNIVSGNLGDDKITIAAGNTTIKYANGDGNDSIWGFTSSKGNKLRIGNGKTDTYSLKEDGNDIIVKVGEGSIRVIGGGISEDDIEGTGENNGLKYNAKKTFVTVTSGYSKDKLKSTTDYVDSVVKIFVETPKGMYVEGNTKNNEITGGSGNDTLDGGSGNDTLWGGDGKDKFIYTGGNDVIGDYKDGEVIESTKRLVEVLQSDGDMIYNFGNEGTLRIKNGVGKVINYVPVGSSKF